MEPLYEHDCDACEFVETIKAEGRMYDVYYCPRCEGGTWVARYGDDGPEYWSMAEDIMRTADMTRAPLYRRIQDMAMRRGGSAAVGAFFVSIVLVLILYVGLVFAMRACHGSPGDPVEHNTKEDVLPAQVKIVCVEGHEYLVVRHLKLLSMAPRFNDDGKPAKCRVETEEK